MKLRTFLAMALIALCAVSCSDDDEIVEIEEEIQASTQVAGSYTGVTQLAVGGSPSGAFDGTIKIEGQKDGKVSVVFPEIKMNPKMSLQSFTLTDVEVKSVSDKEFIFEHAAFTVSAGGTDYVSAKGLKGTLKDGVLALTYDIKPGAMPMSIDFSFTNDKEDMFAAKVVGTYKGAALLSVMKEAAGSFLGEVKIAAMEGGKFSVTVGGYMNMPEYVLENVVIKSTGNNEYSIEHGEFTYNDKYVCKNGLKGTLKNGAITLEYGIQPGKMPMEIVHYFTQDKNLVNLTTKYAKKYAGTVSMNVGGKPAGSEEVTYALVTQQNGKMSLSFPKVGTGMMELKSFSLSDVDLKVVNDEEFTIEHAAFEVKVGRGEDMITYTSKKGLKGSFKEGQLTLDYDLAPGEMPVAINFHFGKKEVEVGGAAAKVAGEYKGKFAMSLSGEPSGEVDATINLVATEEGKVTVHVSELTPMPNMKIPAIELKDVAVEAVSETEYTLKHDAFKITLADGKDCVSKKGLKGSVKEGVLTMEFDIQYGKMPLVIDLKFVSAK